MSIQASEPAKVNAKDLLMVLIVTVSWGMNYPIMKYVVNSYPPSAFRAYTFIVGFDVTKGMASAAGQWYLRHNGIRFLRFRDSLIDTVGELLDTVTLLIGFAEPRGWWRCTRAYLPHHFWPNQSLERLVGSV